MLYLLNDPEGRVDDDGPAIVYYSRDPRIIDGPLWTGSFDFVGGADFSHFLQTLKVAGTPHTVLTYDDLNLGS